MNYKKKVEYSEIQSLLKKHGYTNVKDSSVWSYLCQGYCLENITIKQNATFDNIYYSFCILEDFNILDNGKILYHTPENEFTEAAFTYLIFKSNYKYIFVRQNLEKIEQLIEENIFKFKQKISERRMKLADKDFVNKN